MKTEKDYPAHIKNLEDMRQRLSAGKLTTTDIPTIDQMIAGHIELQKSLAASNEKIGDKVVLAKLPFGVDIVK